MPNDINNLDSEDIGLKQILGDHFHDETTKKPTAAKATPKPNNTTNATEAAQKPARKPTAENYKDAEWQPEKHTPSFLENLKDCAKYAVGFGGLNLLIFYWQQAELMDASIAVPSMCVCAALAGFGVGKNFAKEYRR